MAAPALPCDSCGSPISDSDLESGQAITLLGKRYCGGCKAEAIQSVSLDDLSGKSPATETAPARKPAARAAVPAPRLAVSAARPDPAPARRENRAIPKKPAVAAPPSRTPLIAAGAGITAVLLVAAFFIFKSPATPEKAVPAPGTPAPPTTKAPSPPSPSPTSALDRDAQARAAYDKVEEISRRAGTSLDLLLSAIDHARPACKDTEWERRLEDLAARTRKAKESEDSAKELSPLIDELKGAVATDAEFKRYSELQPKFQLAIETASRTGSPRITEIRSLQRDYNSRYEKLAEPFYAEISETANALAEERRYDDALRKIETFPQQYRNSGSWTVLAKLKQDIERRKKQLPPKK
jgi:hypothetical protein